VSVTTSRPLRCGTAAARDTIARVLERAEFNERTIAAALDMPALDAVDHPLFKTFADHLEGRGALEILARLFVFGDAIDRTIVRTHLSEEELDAFLDVDLLRPWTSDRSSRDRLYSPVRLVPLQLGQDGAQHIVLASDRDDHPDGSPFQEFDDIVFSGHNALTRSFVKLLPEAPSGRGLELCTGTGVAAIAMALRGNQCTASDIAARSVHFAQFNAWLNDCHRVEVVESDLYQAMEGERFDCIVAHPPYVPALSNTLTYRDGGETGDAIVRGTIAGIPAHLATGGTFQVLCLAMDTADAPFELRVREWLGPSADEFDLVFAVSSSVAPERLASRVTARAGGSTAELLRYRDLFRRFHVSKFVYGALAGHRFTTTGPAMTRRVNLTDDTSPNGFAWLFRWFDWLRSSGGASRVLDLAPTLSPDLRLDVQHRLDGGTLKPFTYFLENGGTPFRARFATAPWLAAMLSEADGKRSFRDLFQSARTRGWIPEDFGDNKIEALTCSLVERGIVDVPWQHAATASATA
jgi:methylase of polypeptide subunit release factors